MALWTLLALVAAGTVAGALNVVAGGGSLLTLPLLIFFGLPATVANGTNRVAILLQNVVATWRFDRARVLDRSAIVWAALPATVGGGIGAWAAVRLGDEAFQRVLALVMIGVAAVTLVRGALRRRRSGEGRAHSGGGARPVAARGVLVAGFFLVGVYGGFVQAGVGFLILAVTSLAGLDLVRGNAVKVISVLCFTVLALAVFLVGGKVWWSYGLALGVGNMIGGWLGVHLTVLKGHVWVERVVAVTVVVFALRLLWSA